MTRVRVLRTTELNESKAYFAKRRSQTVAAAEMETTEAMKMSGTIGLASVSRWQSLW